VIVQYFFGSEILAGFLSESPPPPPVGEWGGVIGSNSSNVVNKQVGTASE